MRKTTSLLIATLTVLLTACAPKVEIHDVYTGMKYGDFIKIHPESKCTKTNEFSCEATFKDHKLTVDFNGDEKIYLAEDKWHTNQLTGGQVIEIYSEKYGRVKEENMNYQLNIQSIWWCFGKNCESKRTVLIRPTNERILNCTVYGYPSDCENSKILVSAEIFSEELSKKVWYNKQLNDVSKVK